MFKNKKINFPLISIIISYIALASFYIYKTSVVHHGELYFNLFDDAMISMRYAHNLARGYGLVWNIGEAPIEGFTNPLWVLYMAFWHLFPIPVRLMSLPIQITGMLFLAANLYFTYKISILLTDNQKIAVFTTILTGLYMPLNRWGLLGMEVSVLVLLVSAAVYLTLKAYKQNQFTYWPYLLLVIGIFVRIDLAVTFLAIWIINLIFDSKHRKKHLIYGIPLLIFAIGSQTLIRIWYFGDPLPNTYYLKMAGIDPLIRIGNGISALIMLIWNTSWVLVLLPFTILFFRRDKQITLLLFVFAAQVAYSIYVGGDAWEHKGGANRYISQAIPLFFILFSFSFQSIIELLSSTLTFKNSQVTTYLTNSLGMGFLVLSLVQFNSTLETETFYTVEKAFVHTYSGFQWNQLKFADTSEYYLDIAYELESITTDDATILVVTAGTIPYFTDNPTIDLMGKNDAYVAHLDSKVGSSLLYNLTTFRPGHSKWDYAYSIGELQPDVIVQLWNQADQALEFINPDYVYVDVDQYTFTVRENSPNILWDQAKIVEP